MAYTVLLMPPARRQFERVVAWWNANRPAAQDLVQQELDRAVETIAAFPESGRPLNRRRRLVLLPKTERQLIYRVDHVRHLIEILSLRPARKP